MLAVTRSGPLSRIEKALFLSPYVYLAVVLLPVMVWSWNSGYDRLFGVMGVDKLVVLFGLLVGSSMATVLRDLCIRKLPEGVSKFRWFLLMVYTCGVGYYVYVFRYAWRPREAV